MYSLWNITSLRLKLIYRNKSILMLAIVIMLIFGALVSSIYAHVERSITIPVAYVNESGGAFAGAVVHNVNENDLFDLVPTNLDDGIKMLKDNEIQLLFLITEDAENKVLKGDFVDLIELYYISENYLSPMLGDVIVGEMFQEISLKTALLFLENAIDDQGDLESILKQAYEHGLELAKESQENYYVSIEFIELDSNTIIDDENIENELIYKQMILGIIISFIAFYILFAAINIVKDQETHLIGKIKVTQTNNIAILLGEYFSLLIATSSIVLIFAMISAYYSPDFLKHFIGNFLILMLYSCAISALVLFVTKIFTKVASFIVVGTAIVLILGIISGSFFNIDLSSNTIKNIAYFTPSYHTLTQLMNMATIHYFNLKAYAIYILIYTLICIIISIPLLYIKENNY